MKLLDAKEIYLKKLGTHKVMSLATSVNDYPMIRSVSCIFYNDKLYFKTDKNFRKTSQLLENNKVALCFWGVQIEGIAKNLGVVANDPYFEEKFKEYYDLTYIAYAHTDNEILIEVEPKFVEIWDQKPDHKAFQILIDFDKEIAEELAYD